MLNDIVTISKEIFSEAFTTNKNLSKAKRYVQLNYNCVE